MGKEVEAPVVEAVEEDINLDEALAEAEAEEAVAQELEEVPEDDEEIVEPDELACSPGPEEEIEDDPLEGALRLKRLLSRDGKDDGPAAKKAKIDEDPIAREVQTKSRTLLLKWGLSGCGVSKHVLEGMRLEELDEMVKTNYTPNKSDWMKSPSELIARHGADIREKKLMIGGGGLDTIKCFKFRWKMSVADEQKLRGLSHKQLLYTFENFNENKTVDECVAEAELTDEREDCVLPRDPGLTTMSRNNRLELIDPTADSAVFGDANLTFSILLAKHRKAFGHVGRVIATTFEELDTLRERYPEIDESIKTLDSHFAEVYHGVDCTRIASNPQFEGLEHSLGAVYYNFPHSGAIGGFFDGHPIVNWRHENLMKLFFRALRSFVKPGGHVKVSSNMTATGVRYSYIVGSALQNEFVHTETVPFTEWHLHRYGRSYGDKRDVYKRPDAKNNQSYNAQNADRDMVYCFRYAPTGDTLAPQEIRMPPTFSVLKQVVDGPFRQQDTHTPIAESQRMKLAQQLHNRFVLEVSGTHVG